MALEITGKYLGATPTKEVGEKNYKVRSFFVDLTDKPEYPNTPEFGLGGDTNVNLVNDLSKGDTIKVTFDLEGKKYKNRTTGKDGVFTKLRAWKIEKVHEGEQVTASAATQETAAAEDDLPF